MTLIIFAGFPIIAAGVVMFIYLSHKKNKKFQDLYEKADQAAHQAVSSIKTVKSLNAEAFEHKKYSTFLNILKEKVTKWAILAGIGTGIYYFIQYCTYSFGFWYATHCVGGTHLCSPSVTGSVYTPG